MSSALTVSLAGIFLLLSTTTILAYRRLLPAVALSAAAGVKAGGQ